MSGEKGGGAGAPGADHTVDVPILGLLQTDSGNREFINDTVDKLPKVSPTTFNTIDKLIRSVCM